MDADTPVERNSVPPPRLKGYPLFRIFGFEVKLNPTWLLLALLITWTLAAGLFPTDYPGLSRATYWWMGVAGAVGILFSIVLHELSHSLIARRFGLSMRGITLFIFGGIAEMEEEPASPRVEFWMAIAGPLMSILLAIIFYLFVQLAITLDWFTPVIGVSHYLAVVNMIIALFNLVPAFPLDGGRMLRAILWHWKKNLRVATRITTQLGSGFGIAMMILGGLAFIQGNFIGGMWYFLIGTFLWGAAKTSYQQMLVREVLSGKPVRDFMQNHPITVSPELSIRQWVEDYVYQHHFRMFPVVENNRLLGCISTQDLRKLPRENWHGKTVRDLTVPCSSGNTVSPDSGAEQLVSHMTRPEAGTRFMVVEDERLVGVISLKDLREYITLKLEIESR